MKVSIIIPALNEAERIAETLTMLAPCRDHGHELIVVDGGSSDETVAIAQSHADKVLHSDRGRARQMNHGIKEARGDILLFLHADTRMAHQALTRMIDAIEEGYFWGRFNVRLSGSHLMFRIIERMMKAFCAEITRGA